ncbi:MAG: nucleotidyltransferase family protein [Candidatus Omnitrophica bacterium]|nr:nucleotidyltransferase family protein [Candidatus Omnitrophota bacterium]
MKVLILAAGYGTRLKSIAENTPKPLLPINGKPLINFILDRIKGFDGLNEILVITNNKFTDTFKEWAQTLDVGCPVTIINDGTNSPEERLGSIGDIQFAIKDKKIKDDLLVIGGDNLFDYNLDTYIMFAKKKSGSTVIGLYDVGDLEEAKLYGVVGVDQTGKVNSFEEKPAQPKSTLISMCFYYFPGKTLSLVEQYLKEQGKPDKAGDYIRWLYQKTDVYGFKFSGKWYDIGSIEAYNEAQKNFKN